MTTTPELTVGTKLKIKLTGETTESFCEIKAVKSDGNYEVVFNPPVMIGYHHLLDGCISPKEILEVL